MAEYPNLGGVVKLDDVKKKAKGFASEYVSWATTLQRIRDEAPGWHPGFVANANQGMEHLAPDGTAYLLLYWRHADGTETLPVPHAVMDNRSNSIGREKLDSRSLSDAYVRGVCKAAAVSFGFAYELWAKEEIDANSKPASSKKTAPAASRSADPVADAKAAIKTPAEQRTMQIGVAKVVRNSKGVVGKFGIEASDGTVYTTFEQTIAEMAKHVKDSGGQLELTLEKDGRFEKLASARPIDE